jgi:hypothetical protein
VTIPNATEYEDAMTHFETLSVLYSSETRETSSGLLKEKARFRNMSRDSQCRYPVALDSVFTEEIRLTEYFAEILGLIPWRRDPKSAGMTKGVESMVHYDNRQKLSEDKHILFFCTAETV